MAPTWRAMTRPDAAVPCPWSCKCTGVIVMIATMTSWVRIIVSAPGISPGPRVLGAGLSVGCWRSRLRASSRGSGRSRTASTRAASA